MKSVRVTGNFDNWSKSVELKEKGAEFQGWVTVPNREKLVFKFVINEDNWVISHDYNIEFDDSGIENNYLDPDNLTEVVHEDTQVAPSPASDPLSKDKVASVTQNPDVATITKAPEIASEPSPPALTAVKVPSRTIAALGNIVPSPETPPPTTTDSPTKSGPKIPEPSSRGFDDVAPITKSEPLITAPPTKPEASESSAPPVTTAPPVSVSVPPSTTVPPVTSAPKKLDTSTASPEPLESTTLPLTQILTTTSSFAGVSLPSQDSTFEHLDDTGEEDQLDDEEEDEEDINQFNTPTNSLFNSGVLTTPTKTDSSSTNPTSARKKKGDVVEILQAPGAYPSSSFSNSSSNDKDKKDGLVSRFKSLFRY